MDHLHTRMMDSLPNPPPGTRFQVKGHRMYAVMFTYPCPSVQGPPEASRCTATSECIIPVCRWSVHWLVCTPERCLFGIPFQLVSMRRNLLRIGQIVPFGHLVWLARPFFVDNLRPFSKGLDIGLDGRFGPLDIGMLPNGPVPSAYRRKTAWRTFSWSLRL